MDIQKGTRFDTDFEVGCEALETPDDMGHFDALDCERVRCSFHTCMVEGHPLYLRSVYRPAIRKGE